MPDHPFDDEARTGPSAALRERLLRHARDGEMLRPGLLPDLALLRNDQPQAFNCAVYEPCVALIVQGAKRVTLGDETFAYGPGRCLIAAMDLPVTAALIEASPARPYLAVALRLDAREIAALLLEGARPAPEPRLPPQRAMSTAAVDAPLIDAFARLLALLDAPTHAAVLAPLIRREIHYRLLTGEAGPRLRQMAEVDGQARQIGRAISRLRAAYAESLRVEELAREAGMSVSTFHQHFKACTAMSPLQFQKQLRLSEARRLMLAERLDAATAAYRVGYESPSQFSREYSRQFGAPPMRDIGALRSATPG